MMRLFFLFSQIYIIFRVLERNNDMKIGKITEQDYIKAIRRADRLREIEAYGKVISTRPAMRSPGKKTYNRKRDKKEWQ